MPELYRETVHEITLNGARLDPATRVDGRITLPALTRRNELRVVAGCSCTGSGTGMHRSDETWTYIYGKLPLELTGKGLDFCTTWLGAPYPYAKYGLVFVPELSTLVTRPGC